MPTPTLKRISFLALIPLFMLGMLLLMQPAHAATYTVDTNADDSENGADCTPNAGSCSLRDAITAANNNAGADTIEFSIGGGGAQTITLAFDGGSGGVEALQVTDAVTIDGTSQPGYVAGKPPSITIDGTNVTVLYYGLWLMPGSDGSTVEALEIKNLPTYSGLGISDSNTTVLASYIHDNGSSGIFLSGQNGTLTNTQIGDGTTNGRNVISHNGLYGIHMATGSDELDLTTNTFIQGNFFGTNWDGDAGEATWANSNGGIGVGNVPDGLISNLTIGGAAACVAGMNNCDGNLIADGIVLSRGIDTVTIQNNFLGTNANGNADITTSNIGIFITDNVETITIEDNLISGFNSGITIMDAANPGIPLGITIQGNQIGTDFAGTGDLGNNGDGIQLIDLDYTTYGPGSIQIGGSNPGVGFGQDGNLIAGNSGDGIQVEDSPFDSGEATIQNNYIGTDINGTSAISNDNYGIYVIDNVSNVDILDNVISANTNGGIYIADVSAGTNDPRNISIEGNLIGTDKNGLTSIIANNQNGNNEYGIRIQNLDLTSLSGTIRIGGPGPDDTWNTADDAQGRNVISGSDVDGVYVYNCDFANNQLFIQNNYIGVNVNGTAAIVPGTCQQNGEDWYCTANRNNGIYIDDTNLNASGTPWITIGGDRTLNQGNVISGNDTPPLDTGVDGNGILLGDVHYSKIYGNNVGTDSAGTTAVRNEKRGIIIDDGTVEPSYHQIGLESDVNYGNLISGTGWQNGGGAGQCDDSCNAIETDSANYVSIYNNIIGLNINKNAALGNYGHGMQLEGGSNLTVGSTTGPNIIGGNAGDGVNSPSSDGPLVIKGNYIGSNDLGGFPDYGNTGNGITITNSSNSSNVIQDNEVHHNNNNGLLLFASFAEIKGNSFNNNSSTGIAAFLGNSYSSFDVNFPDAPVIGGSNASDKNTVQNNTNYGISLTEYTPSNESSLWSHNTISGNGGGGEQVQVNFLGAIEVLDINGDTVTSTSTPTVLTVTDAQSNTTAPGLNFAPADEACTGSVDECSDIADQGLCDNPAVGCSWNAGAGTCDDDGVPGLAIGTVTCQWILDQLGQATNQCNVYMNDPPCVHSFGDPVLGVWGQQGTWGTMLGFAFEYDNYLSWPSFISYALDATGSRVEYTPYTVNVTSSVADGLVTGTSRFSWDADDLSDPVPACYDAGTVPFSQANGHKQVAQVQYNLNYSGGFPPCTGRGPADVTCPAIPSPVDLPDKLAVSYENDGKPIVDLNWESVNIQDLNADKKIQILLNYFNEDPDPTIGKNQKVLAKVFGKHIFETIINGEDLELKETYLDELESFIKEEPYPVLSLLKSKGIEDRFSDWWPYIGIYLIKNNSDVGNKFTEMLRELFEFFDIKATAQVYTRVFDVEPYVLRPELTGIPEDQLFIPSAEYQVLDEPVYQLDNSVINKYYDLEDIYRGKTRRARTCIQGIVSAMDNELSMNSIFLQSTLNQMEQVIERLRARGELFHLLEAIVNDSALLNGTLSRLNSAVSLVNFWGENSNIQNLVDFYETDADLIQLKNLFYQVSFVNDVEHCIENEFRPELKKIVDELRYDMIYDFVTSDDACGDEEGRILLDTVYEVRETENKDELDDLILTFISNLLSTEKYADIDKDSDSFTTYYNKNYQATQSEVLEGVVLDIYRDEELIDTVEPQVKQYTDTSLTKNETGMIKPYNYKVVIRPKEEKCDQVEGKVGTAHINPIIPSGQSIDVHVDLALKLKEGYGDIFIGELNQLLADANGGSANYLQDNGSLSDELLFDVLTDSGTVPLEEQLRPSASLEDPCFTAFKKFKNLELDILSNPQINWAHASFALADAAFDRLLACEEERGIQYYLEKERPSITFRFAKAINQNRNQFEEALNELSSDFVEEATQRYELEKGIRDKASALENQIPENITFEQILQSKELKDLIRKIGEANLLEAYFTGHDAKNVTLKIWNADTKELVYEINTSTDIFGEAEDIVFENLVSGVDYELEIQVGEYFLPEFRVFQFNTGTPVQYGKYQVDVPIKVSSRYGNFTAPEGTLHGAAPETNKTEAINRSDLIAWVQVANSDPDAANIDATPGLSLADFFEFRKNSGAVGIATVDEGKISITELLELFVPSPSKTKTLSIVDRENLELKGVAPEELVLTIPRPDWLKWLKNSCETDCIGVNEPVPLVAPEYQKECCPGLIFESYRKEKNVPVVGLSGYCREPGSLTLESFQSDTLKSTQPTSLDSLFMLLP